MAEIFLMTPRTLTMNERSRARSWEEIKRLGIKDSGRVACDGLW
jgi:hypothetical protein